MAYREVKIEIHQALHGYLNGHQLLACSKELSIYAKKTLLFQSDLTGSMVESGYDSYITGYPIKDSNIYVFAKTWYANEMPRPGCVWTHSLLIDFADIGKIPELDCLYSLFKRPEVNQYLNFAEAISFEIPFDDRNLSKLELDNQHKFLIKAIYENPANSVLVSSSEATIFETNILKLWSNQWPRLRRNFTFCSGSLSLKTLEEKEFDLQIIPERNITSVDRQSKQGKLLDYNSESNSEWIKIIEKYPKENLRKFLWSFGSDIEGERINYIPLLKLFDAINNSSFSLSDINQYVNEFFPSLSKGKFLKKSLFGSKSMLPVSEKEIVKFLLTSEEQPNVDFNELSINERVASLINSNEFSTNEFAELFKNIKYERIDNSVWDKLKLSHELILQLIRIDSDLIPTLVEKWPSIANSIEIWQLDFSVQRQIFYSILKLDDIDWHSITINVLQSKSEIIFDFRKNLGARISAFSLEWTNSSLNNVLIEEWSKYIAESESVFKEWVISNKANLNRNIYQHIFKYLSPSEIGYLSLEPKYLIAGYEDFRTNSTKNFFNSVSIKLLAVGLNNKLFGSHLLVERTFPIVYTEVCKNEIGNNIWKTISKESAIKDHTDFNPFFIWTFFEKKNKNKFEAEYWDIGRNLIIKVVNQYLRNGWPLQSFVATFQGKKEFKDSILYCSTFEAGLSYIEKLYENVENGKLKINPNQVTIFNKLFR